MIRYLLAPFRLCCDLACCSVMAVLETRWFFATFLMIAFDRCPICWRKLDKVDTKMLNNGDVEYKGYCHKCLKWYDVEDTDLLKS